MTPEERAEARWPDDIKATHLMPYSDCSANQIAKRVGCICCIREQVEPLEAERDKLRALVQVLVDRHGEVKWDADHCDWSCERCGNDYGMKETDLYDSTEQALSAAKEQGFVPTNTEDK